MKTKGAIVATALVLGCFSSQVWADRESCPAPVLMWNDEFDGDTLNTQKWDVQLGDGCNIGLCGWGNDELQSYSREAATVSDGTLKITAAKTGDTFTSARIRTGYVPEGGSWTNGRFEARIKLPEGAGIWPAFWMLPTGQEHQWPITGEIDIMEFVGRDPKTLFGTLHFGPKPPNNQQNPTHLVLDSGTWAGKFYEFAVEWTPNEMKWFVDDLLYAIKTPSDLQKPEYWTFENHAYHMILNVAIGGKFGGELDESILPQIMEVDYVRAYDRGKPGISGPLTVSTNTTSTYTLVGQIPEDSQISWSGPNRQTGSGLDFQVTWENTGGTVKALISNQCGTQTVSVDAIMNAGE